MGYQTFDVLGQMPRPRTLPPLLPSAGGVTDTLEQRYEDLRDACAERYGDDFCNAVLPRNLVYAITREDQRPTVPWWGWMLMGAFVGRLLR